MSHSLFPEIKMLRCQRLRPLLARTPRRASTMATLKTPRKVRQNVWEDNTFIPYADMAEKLAIMRKRIPRPLNYAEKILFSHVDNPHEQEVERGVSYLKLRPDRVASHDATAQMALLQFLSSGLPSVATPMTVHCDHLIIAKEGAVQDTDDAYRHNQEVYDFLSAACAKYNIGFWKPGSGIIHQILLENYAFPGGLMIGTDSHTPNAGGLSMCAIGVGGGDAVDAMAGLPWDLKSPSIIGVKLTGALRPWSSPKDIILQLAGTLTTKGGTGAILEFFGPGTETLSTTGAATVANMGAETGATTSLFPFNNLMGKYLAATGRSDVAEYAKTYSKELLSSDEGAEYDKVVEINLSELEPFVNGPFTPDLATPLSKFKQAVEENRWPAELKMGLVGSCTNASYDDMCRAASIARNALDHGVKSRVPFMITPGSEQIRATTERDGHLHTLEEFGGTVLANACGPCIGSWDRQDGTKTGEANSIISSYNRNFPGRNDGNPVTHSFVTSPAVVVSMAAAGTLTFNPTTDQLTNAEGQTFLLDAPIGSDLPPNGYDRGRDTYQAPPTDAAERASLSVTISPESQRLQYLQPFAPWDGKDAEKMPILIKAKGKTTTDDISRAGPWLKYRGHLENISNNLLIGATNAANNEQNNVKNCFTQSFDSVPAVARQYKSQGEKWVVIGDWNLGEGSSREHAALEPRYLNGFAFVARSLARIFETNLKKQGVLPLTFRDAGDYDRIEPSDKISILCSNMEVGEPVTMVVHPEDRDRASFEVSLAHTLNAEQMEWFVSGSSLNSMAKTLVGF